MRRGRRFPIRLIVGLFGAAWASVVFVSTAEAQFFWFFDQQKAATPKPRAKARPPGDDLPPIVPRESSAPPPPDDRPYDDKLMRLAEILGAIHYLRELCGASEGQVWREQMKEILRNEGTTAVRRAKLVNAFNDGYRGYRRSYRTCTQSATLATNRFSTEGATIAAALAQNSTYAAKGPAEGTPQAVRGTGQDQPAPAPDQAGTAPPAAQEGPTGAIDAGSGTEPSQAAAPQAPEAAAPGPQGPEPPD
jgi:uncharacterized protein (TIGR02301 family)